MAHYSVTSRLVFDIPQACFHTLTIMLKYNSGLVSQYKSDRQSTEAKKIGRKIKSCFIISTHPTSIKDFQAMWCLGSTVG